MNRPTERKVYAATLGAGAGTIISEFALWGADAIWWPDPNVGIPTPVAAIINLAVIAGFTYGAGWLAKHDPGYTQVEELPDPAVNL
jgi:hypothetical protein